MISSKILFSTIKRRNRSGCSQRDDWTLSQAPEHTHLCHEDETYDTCRKYSVLNAQAQTRVPIFRLLQTNFKTQQFLLALKTYQPSQTSFCHSINASATLNVFPAFKSPSTNDSSNDCYQSHQTHHMSSASINSRKSKKADTRAHSI